MATFKAPSAAVLAARGRSSAGAAGGKARIEWFIKNVTNKVELSMKKRVKIATALLYSQTTKNISRPVTKGTGPRGGRVVTDRSKEGEFPKADTTQLMKTLIEDVRQVGGVWTGHVGTPLDYGVILETKMNRSFLVRTLNENRSNITRILTGPIK